MLVKSIFMVFSNSSNLWEREGLGSTFSRASLKTGTSSSLRRDIWSLMRFNSHSRVWILESREKRLEICDKDMYLVHVVALLHSLVVHHLVLRLLGPLLSAYIRRNVGHTNWHIIVLLEFHAMCDFKIIYLFEEV